MGKKINKNIKYSDLAENAIWKRLNRRRAKLIEKEYKSKLSTKEFKELESLQEITAYYINLLDYNYLIQSEDKKNIYSDYYYVP